MIYDAIVIGTGAGGSTVSKELSNKGLNVLILEKGTSYKAGTATNHIITTSIDLKSNNIDFNKISRDKNPKTKANYEFFNFPAELMHVEGMGGTTTVTLANACYSYSACDHDSDSNHDSVRNHDSESNHNSDISYQKPRDLNQLEELMENNSDIEVSYIPRKFIGPATIKIAKAAEKLGYMVEAMPKFIDFEKCNNCGLCISGCPLDAKWEASHFINEAVTKGATLIEDFEVTKVLHQNSKVTGVEGKTADGQIKEFKAKNVVLSAGSLNTPHILRNTGITSGVGEGLFVDLFITVGGYMNNAGLNTELPMGIKSEFEHYFLSPHFSAQLVQLLQEKGYPAKNEDVLGIMVKIADESNGKILEDGSIEKKLTINDAKYLMDGYDKAAEILLEAGVDESSIVSTPIRGAHPGGTAAVGRVVDKSLETEIKGLYIADASVIQRAPGKPPILNINSLAKKAAENIVKQMKG